MDFWVEQAAQQKAEINSEGLIGTTNIKVIGVGGAGNNMVGWLYKKGVKGAEVLACNTDKQHLGIIEADKKFLIGASVTRNVTIDTTAPNITLISPSNLSGIGGADLTFSYNVTDANNVNNCSVIINNVENSSATSISACP